MAKFYDLSQYLSNEPTKIKVGTNEFTVRDGFNDLLKVDALTNQRDEMGDTEFFQQFLRVSLGEEQASTLIALNLPIKAYFKVMNIIQDVYSGNEDDDSETKEGDGQVNP